MTGVLTIVLVAGCTTGTPPPSGNGTPTLAVAYLDGGSSRVAVFETPGSTSELRAAGLFSLPNGLLAYSAVLGPDGDLYVATSVDGAIVAIAADDVEDSAGPTTPVPATGRVFTSPEMLNPVSLAFDARGDLWVADGRNATPSNPGPNRLLRFEDPSSIADGAAVDAATVLDLAPLPAGHWDHRFIYAIHIDEEDRLWYADHYSWAVGRIDDLAERQPVETDVVPDMQFITWDPADAGDVPAVANPVGLTVSDAGDLYLGSNDGDFVYRFDDAANWSGFLPDTAPSALLAVGITKPRFVAIDAEGGLWALTNTDRKMVRVEGHAGGSSNQALTPSRTVTWASSGMVLGGGMSFASP